VIKIFAIEFVLQKNVVYVKILFYLA